MNSLRVAVVGLSHGKEHIAALARHPRAKVTAIVDTNPAALESAAAMAPEAQAFAGVAEMLRAAVADAAVIAVPTAFHADVAEACLLGGLHVLLEKPLCRTDDEAQRIFAAIQTSSRVLQIGYEVRSSPLHRSIMNHIARGDLGEVTNVWWHQHTNQGSGAYGGWRQDRKNMGGALFDCSPHFLDLIGQWAGAPAVRVFAFGNLRGQIGPCSSEVLPESAAISLEYASGVRGTFNFGAVNRFNDDATFGVAGTSGCIRGNAIDAGSYELRTDFGVRVGQVRFDPKLTSPGHLGFVEQWQAFLDTVLEGKPNVCTFGDGLAVHQLMSAIDRSLTTGLPVAL